MIFFVVGPPPPPPLYSIKLIILIDLERRKEIAEITPKKVTQGGTFNNDEVCCAAPHAVDGDLSTHAVTHTLDGAGWINLEFDKTYFIHKVVIYYWFYDGWYNPDDVCVVQGVRGFMNCVNNDNNVDVSVYEGDVKQNSCGTLQLTYGLKRSDQIYTLLCNTRGDTVKLSKSTGNIAAYEIVITGTGKTLSITFLSLDTYILSKFRFSVITVMIIINKIWAPESRRKTCHLLIRALVSARGSEQKRKKQNQSPRLKLRLPVPLYVFMTKTENRNFQGLIKQFSFNRFIQKSSQEFLFW